jgi:restriction system protein
MAIPDYQTVMLPLLRFVSQNEQTTLRQAIDFLAAELKLTAEERSAVLPSGVATVFASRVGWAKTYLKQAGLLDQPQRGAIRLTDRGRALLAERPSGVNNRALERYPEFAEFKARSRKAADGDERSETLPAAIAAPPAETIETAAQALQQALARDVLEALMSVSPARFEQIVLDLLVTMGYGGNRAEAVEALGRGGDGGVDGLINEDRLGLSAIYIQAKRWQATVGEPVVRDFLGALVGRGAVKGVLLTTAEFSAAARAFAGKNLQHKIVLVDGVRLAELMIEHGLGVTTLQTYAVRRIDSDFFVED